LVKFGLLNKLKQAFFCFQWTLFMSSGPPELPNPTPFWEFTG